MKIWILAAASLAALSTAAYGQNVQAAKDTHSLADDAAAFGSRAAISAPHLSPDGSSVLYVTPGAGPKTYAVISNLVTGKSTVVTGADGNPDILRWCDYAALDRVVCRVTANTINLSDIVGFERLISMTAEGKDQKLLGQPQSFFDAGIRQSDARVLDWGSRSDGTLLMEREYVPEEGKLNTRLIRSKEGLGVDRVDTRSLRAVPVEQPNPIASGYLADGRGNIRVMRVDGADATGTLSGLVKYLYRTPGSNNWKLLADDAREEDQIEPLAIDADADSLYALRKAGGRYALYAMKLDGSGAQTAVASNSRVDIEDAVRIGDGLKVIGYTYSDEKPHTVYFDPEFKALSESLSRALPHLPIVDFVDATSDGRKLLVFAGSDTDPGRYYLFDRDKKTLNEAMLERPQLEGRTLAEVRPVSIPAADGALIPAYLTLPPGRDAKDTPAVVLPHGGPSSRDEWGFDWLAQFLAARGYAVLQPEYRGSSGYGDQWLNDNAFKNWKTAMSDIAASARWLGSQGIADPNRIAILGWSYGGYAALMEAETDPKLYKAVVAIAPVTDLGLLKQEQKHFTNSRVVSDFIGSAEDGEGSPLRHVDSIQAPVLLVHGDMDWNVRFEQSEKMAAALKSAGKEVEFLSYKGLDHQLADSTARAEMLTHIGQLLDRTIGH